MPPALTELWSDPHRWFSPSHFLMLGLIGGFALAHSGLASLRLEAEKRVGPRPYRVLFAVVSISLAVVLITYFLNHRYDGVQLWQVQGQPWVMPFVWVLSAISFIFLYPSIEAALQALVLKK